MRVERVVMQDPPTGESRVSKRTIPVSSSQWIGDPDDGPPDSGMRRARHRGVLVDHAVGVAAVELPSGRRRVDLVGDDRVARRRKASPETVTRSRCAGQGRTGQAEVVAGLDECRTRGQFTREERFRRARRPPGERRKVRRVEPEPARNREAELSAVDDANRAERRRRLRGAARAHETGNGERGENPDQGDHKKHVDEREALLIPDACRCCSSSFLSRGLPRQSARCARSLGPLGTKISGTCHFSSGRNLAEAPCRLVGSRQSLTATCSYLRGLARPIELPACPVPEELQDEHQPKRSASGDHPGAPAI